MKISLQPTPQLDLIVSRCYNNNYSKAVNEITASLTSNNCLIFNSKLFQVNTLASHLSNIPVIDFKNILGYYSTVKFPFTSNVYLLDYSLSTALLSLLKKLKDKYGFFYGTNINLSAYAAPIAPSNKGILDFYINISNVVGTTDAHDYIVNSLHNYKYMLKNSSHTLPLQTVYFSGWEHLKNRGSWANKILYAQMLQILGYPQDTEIFEADAADIILITKYI